MLECPHCEAGVNERDIWRQLSLYLAALVVKIASAQQLSSCCATISPVRALIPSSQPRPANHHRQTAEEASWRSYRHHRQPINSISGRRPARPIGLLQGRLSRFGSRPRQMRCILHCPCPVTPKLAFPETWRSYIHSSELSSQPPLAQLPNPSRRLNQQLKTRRTAHHQFPHSSFPESTAQPGQAA